jgi:hypothetical protein
MEPAASAVLFKCTVETEVATPIQPVKVARYHEKVRNTQYKCEQLVEAIVRVSILGVSSDNMKLPTSPHLL